MSDGSGDESPSSLAVYWRVYGGFPKLVASKYFWGAIVLSLALYPAWWDQQNRAELGGTIVSAIPNLLGFTVGAMAILLAFSTSRFFSVLTERGSPRSAYLNLASMFIHFIIVQTGALIVGVFLKFYSDYRVLGWLAAFMLMYALLCAVATGLSLFGMAEIYNVLADRDPPKTNVPSSGDERRHD
ncbi:hypothetical protein [Nitrobacter sp. TKz-YC02]|uniref:hypothetical protein n=1 Tax=Nitrobacter sp. TKz-YC02 TaxID=3398704 RepID=UPI003CF79A9A